MTKTRAAVPPPPQKRRFLPETQSVQPANNMSSKREIGMTFNMPEDWHKDFKTTAILNDMNMKELLMACFDVWKREKATK